MSCFSVSLSDSGPEMHRLSDVQIGVGDGLIIDYTYCADDGCALSMCLELVYHDAHAVYVRKSVSEECCRNCIFMIKSNSMQYAWNAGLSWWPEAMGTI